jgi:hypothetical protein
MGRFTVLRHQALHSSGSKFYQQVKIEDVTKSKAFLVQHWGKWLNNWDLKAGQTKVMKLNDPILADYEYRDKWHEKQRGKPNKGHYEQHNLLTFRPNNIEQLKEVLIAELGVNSEQLQSIIDHFEGTSRHGAKVEVVETVAAESGVSRDVPTTEGWGSW